MPGPASAEAGPVSGSFTVNRAGGSVAAALAVTLQLGGTLRLTSPGLTVEWVQGRMRFSGEAALDVAHASSRVATLDTLGS